MEPKGFIYFIKTHDGRYVKIGYSKAVGCRFKQIRSACPYNCPIQLMGCIPGTFQTEHDLHLRFAPVRDQGEWFRLTDDGLRSFIESAGLSADVPQEIAVNFKVPAELHLLMKLVCVEREITIQDLALQILERFIDDAERNGTLLEAQ